MRKLLYVGGGVLIGFLILGLTVKMQANSLTEEEFHEHANFAVFLDGEQFDFSRSEFMHIAPCTADAGFNLFGAKTAKAHSDASLEDADDYSDWIHMHDNNGGVIHVHKEGLTYHDFFVGLKMFLDKGSFVDHEGVVYENGHGNELRFFLNNEEVEDLPMREVRDLDEVLVTYGSAGRSQESINNELLKVADDACVSSGSCAHRGIAPVENCGAVKKTPWLIEWLGVK